MKKFKNYFAPIKDNSLSIQIQDKELMLMQ